MCFRFCPEADPRRGVGIGRFGRKPRVQLTNGRFDKLIGVGEPYDACIKLASA
jgi:hypothetical protein